MENILDEIDKFGQALAHAAQPFIDDVENNDEKRAKMREVIRNILFDESGDRNLGIDVSQRERTLQKMLSGFAEIKNAYIVLNDVAVYIKRFPNKNLKVPKSRFLKYHVGNYLNEIYILRERLESYQKIITRAYKHDSRLEGLASQLKKLDVLLSGFDNIIKLRGQHVHQERYNDENFDRLYFYEMMVENNVDVFGDMYSIALRDYRQKWLKTIQANNNSIKEILSRYFAILYPIAFNEKGDWVTPI